MKVWISLIVIYLSFFIWYTDLGGKLTDDEIEYMQINLKAML